MRRTAAARDAFGYTDAIIYEAPVRSFCDGNGDGIGDCSGLCSRLDYLPSLGVTSLWVLPFFPSPPRDDGYDIADDTTVHPSYDTLDDVKRFLAEAHGAAPHTWRQRRPAGCCWPRPTSCPTTHAYFGNGDQCHMAYHFPVMPRIFMGLHVEERQPIVDAGRPRADQNAGTAEVRAKSSALDQNYQYDQRDYKPMTTPYSRRRFTLQALVSIAR